MKIYDLNDYGNGKRLVDKYGECILYVNEWDHWLVYNKTRWEKDQFGQLERMAKSIIEEIREEGENEIDENKKKVKLKAVNRFGNMKSIKGMIASAASEEKVRISSETLDKDNYLINCKNATINLKKDISYKNTPENYITRMTNVNYTSGAPCPRWEKFIDEIMGGDKDLKEFIQRAIGYSLTGSTQEQKLFICYGKGSNGKSILLEILRLLLGDYSCNIKTESILLNRSSTSANPDIAKLKGIRFVTSQEIQEGKKLDEALIKEITGSDTITARFLYKNEFDFKPEFKLWLATNYKPVVNGTDDGIWRRLILIPFNCTFTDKKGNKDSNLLDKLKEELSGILNWCIKGYRYWEKHGLNEPAIIKTAINEYKIEMDILEQFIAEKLIIKSNATIKNSRLVELYNTWNNSNISTQAFGKIFKEKVAELGLRKERKNYGFIWIGIGEVDTIHN
ncbi:DNA primase family protein [Clostridium sp. ZS2-4]|uniref:DNA primase family protein n=1 Tax=Clostridium sp. ZS2-4 TaxID=2987703 RepID=UPI00227CE5D0|nr:phage/plasmid primase, P4 family [Clostridium sp. ZS2-4]MCY6354347.1 phage/plasmid primase, P4 family [Clostridium sp. ZS2-4]